nr:RNA-directed DNA polymerase, eukaryota [Tanacetum cinerariifolium]
MVMSGSQRSKEDDVQKISTSVFVTNFPDGYGAKDLWNTCKLYGHVVDVFIPDRRTKAGKRFGFVRFIKVLDIDRLINNLCMVWVRRNKIHANVERFQREPLHKQSNKVNNKGTNNVNLGAKGMTNSYAHLVKGNQVQNVGMEDCPNMVLDETCLNHEDFSLCLLGKVKEFASLTNLKVVLGKEGYANIELKYMGGFWVMIVFQDDETKKRFQFNLAVGSWFSQIIQAHNDFLIDERVIWVEVRVFHVSGGLEIHLAVSHLDGMICMGGVSENLKDVEGKSDREEVPETNFEEVPDKSIFEGNSVRQNDVHYDDPFGIYEVLNKKRDGKNIYDKHKDSLKYPPGFTPNEEGDVPVEKVDNWSDENRVNDGQEDGVCVRQHVHERVEVSNDTHKSTCSGHFNKSEVPRKGGSILELIDDLVNVGGILCVWDPNMFQKINDMVSDYFIMVRGVWVSSGKRLLIISDGEVVIMGDFNEVRDISERFGSIFNKHGVEAFNSFIVNAGLVEVPLGGCSFTWCHKSAKKMSKLDRFLISDNLMCSCLSISSTSLDRFLSDHRPIIMQEAHYDYGLIPFKFFHYWFELDGFGKLVEQTWLEANAKLHKESLNSRKSILKAVLADLDGVIDKGEGSDADGHRRREVVRLIQEVEKVDAMEVAQKAKIKWSIKGDENSKYYHGVLNKKRGRLIIREVLVDSILMESPHLVKHEFFEHFKNRFEKPNKSRILLERDFVKRISLEQNDDLEREVSNEEIKRAVWDCGIDKAPELDGFTFEIPKGGNSSFITLIPKVSNANMVKDFKPISLIGSLYKVIAKVLANRLVTVLDDNKKKQSMIFKVDFEKAYDSIRWDFIDGILRRFSFGEKWCKINMNKSNLMGISMDSNKVKHAAAKIGASKYGIYPCAFFNGADVNSKKPCWVRWKSVLAAKDIGGLGVSSLFALNRELMFKWVWRFFSQKNSLWVRVVKALHGEYGKVGKKVQPRRNPRGGVEQAQFERLKEMVEGGTLRYFEDEMDQRGSH